ncbi:hypothetical protein TL18_00395 [Methanobrevibacter sp. YE315]|uniref:DUF192 domain-containing protein n=1 Tax=Methanobrevibacter sp. YE315 TaxID=1609968 RepID=UPI000764D8C2|nr:DUF192 domain-containing protein [Methanobrevibacter sp. YE315]AMD16630.1 hypothetical protein TL18_00395 [Methanobrevibacter sp. YE315]
MIFNRTTYELINMEIRYADTFFKRFKGLMLKKDIDFCMVFTNLEDSSIHTLFMRFEIDVYFLDEKKSVVDKTTLKPWRFYKGKNQVKYVLETKKDILKIEIGDELDFI